jgi:tripartite-type tricarboxylate transporter receptor subunit TctC
MNRREVVALGLASLSTTALSPALFPALAQSRYPDRPIRLMVPFSAGGVVDAVARQWAERVKPHLGTIVIENQGGGGGTTATGEVARAQPDGYTALLANTSVMVLNPAIMPKVPYDPIKDFAPVSILAISASGIMIHPSVPAKTLKEFVTYAKANANKLSYGSAGAGTMTQLAGELFKQMIGAPEITHVPYRGAGPVMQDLIGGRLDYMCDTIQTGAQQAKAGAVKGIAVMAPKRVPIIPDLATTGEQGLPGVEASVWNAFFLPKGTPEPIVRKLNRAMRDMLDNQALRARLEELGLEIMPPEKRSPEYLAKLLAEDIERWRKVIVTAGISTD